MFKREIKYTNTPSQYFIEYFDWLNIINLYGTFSVVRFQTITLWPELSRFLTIPEPIMPNPRKPNLSVDGWTFFSFRVWETRSTSSGGVSLKIIERHILRNLQFNIWFHIHQFYWSLHSCWLIQYPRNKTTFARRCMIGRHWVAISADSITWIVASLFSILCRTRVTSRVTRRPSLTFLKQTKHTSTSHTTFE